MNEWKAVIAGFLFLLFAFGFVCWMGSAPTINIPLVQAAHGAEAPNTVVCDYPESLLTDALKDEPERLVAKLEGKALASFLSKMEAKGYMSGVLPSVTAIYIISGKLMPGHSERLDILFFIDTNHCIVGKVIGTASSVEELL